MQQSSRNAAIHAIVEDLDIRRFMMVEEYHAQVSGAFFFETVYQQMAASGGFSGTDFMPHARAPDRLAFAFRSLHHPGKPGRASA